MSDQFAKNARLLVGMTMGARKRLLAREAWKELDSKPYLAGIPGGASQEEAAVGYRRWVARAIRSYLLMSNHLRKKLRPCPGCIGCCLWVIREKKPGQFVGRWVPRDEPRGTDPEYDQAIWQILDLMNAERPMDRRIDLQPVCDDSGTLQAGRPLG